MNQIAIMQFPINGAEINSVNAREIHDYLQVKTKFADWIKRAIDKYDFMENEDYAILKNGNGNNSFIDYIVSIDMAKELSMLENNEKGKETRKYFIQVEKQFHQPVQEIPSDPMQVLKIMFNAMEQTNSRLDKLEQTSTIDSAQQQKIQSAIARRIRELQTAHNINNELRPKLFSRMYGMVKREFHVGSYKDIQKVRFDEAIVKISGTTLKDGVL